jgi:OTT_1508-like deaminase
LDWLEGDGGSHPSRFFNGYKYIGCSKPTCRLCEHYFSVHASGVEVRPPHRNLYPNWRVPDVYEDQGPQAIENRESLMANILKLVRKETFRVLLEKLPEGKRHDSNTDQTYPLGSISGGRAECMEHLDSSLKDLELDFSDHEEFYSLAEPDSFDKCEEVTPASDDDDEDGGAASNDALIYHRARSENLERGRQSF